MGLQVIYGRSGTGKSTYIFKEIAKKIENKQDRKIYIITPEQFSYTLEKKLLDSIKKEAVTKAEVITFNRMAFRLINNIRRAKSLMLSSSGKEMLIYDILLNKKSELKFIGKTYENVELIGTQITEFKKHKITPETLENAINESSDTYLNFKIKDMLEVYKEYQNRIIENYIDENDALSILSENLDKLEEFKNCDIYIDEFVGFTKQEYEIIRALLKKNNNIFITVCTDELNINDNKDTDIFYSNKQTLDKILQIAKEENIKIENPIFLSKTYRYKNEELKELEENLYKANYNKYLKDVENIELFLANNQYTEIEHIAERIIFLVRDYGYRYNEISVITKNLEIYSNLCKIIFKKYDIPVFIDEKKDLSQNVLVRYILGILNIFAKNWSYESVFEYLKTGFLDIDDMDINLLENYCLKWGVKGSKWYKSKWDFYDEEEEEKEKILHIREKIVNPLLKLKEELSNKKTVKEITEKLYLFLMENEINKKLEIKILELIKEEELQKAKEYEASYKILMDLFDEIVLVLGINKVSFEKYADILKTGLKGSSLGKIPVSQDMVIVGDVDRSRSHRVKAVFIIGINDGMFPNINRNEGFFNDKDREKLKGIGAELAKGTIENIYDDKFNIYKAFSTAEEKLYLSYSSSDLEGRALRPSNLINRIKKIFVKVKENSDIIKKSNVIINEEVTFEELLNEIREIKENKENDIESNEILQFYNYYEKSEKWKPKLENSIKALNYTNNCENIDKECIEKLYGKILKTSVSRLEQYKSCPFSYYLKYGLNLKNKNEFKIEAIDTGTFMHDVIDEFFYKLEENKIKVKFIEEKQIDKIVDEIIEEKLNLKKNYIFVSIPKYRLLIVRLNRVIKKSIKYIVYSLKYSQFDVLGHELEFKNGKELKPIKIDLDDGKSIEITGKIDRLDIAKTEDGNYIRIIDYKSSVKDINLNEVIAGLQLQLLTYLDAVCDEKNFLPAGVLYFNLIDKKIKANKNISDEEIEEELRKQFKMKGLLLADVQIVKMMDSNLKSGNSEIIPAYIDKEGNLSNKSSIITKKQFESLQKYTKKMIKQISTEILSGNIDIKPYYKMKNKSTPCEYCKYKSICNFNNGLCKNSYEFIGNTNKEALLESIKD